VVTAVVAAVVGASQNAHAQDVSAVADAIKHIQNDEPDPAPENRLTYVGIIRQARAVEAIPALEDYYERTKDQVIKQGIASALVSLGDNKRLYLDYLAADAIQRIRNNDLGEGPVDAMAYINWIAYAKVPEAMSVLENYYSRTTDTDIQAGVASLLVRMGDKKETYWNYLVELAQKAVQSDAPDPFNLAAGKQDDPISPDFKLWASTHNIPLEKALTMIGELAQDLAPLARTGDPRGVPLLRKALGSPVLLVSSVAAAGLAQANDVSSVPLIVDACRRLPPEGARLLADDLLFFDDPLAQSTFHFYFPDVNVAEVRAFRGGVFAGIPRQSK
jgi:hypothetical protein